jgi:hypothetical protein
LSPAQVQQLNKQDLAAGKEISDAQRQASAEKTLKEMSEKLRGLAEQIINEKI